MNIKVEKYIFENEIVSLDPSGDCRYMLWIGEPYNFAAHVDASELGRLFEGWHM